MNKWQKYLGMGFEASREKPKRIENVSIDWSEPVGILHSSAIRIQRGDHWIEIVITAETVKILEKLRDIL